MKITFRLLLLCLFFQVPVFAQMYEDTDDNSLPKMEAGIGFAYGETIHYPGSDQRTKLFLPFPAFVYRGERVRADRSGGLRNRFFYNERIEINMSLGGAFPVSEDNDERAGMPELDMILEVGPGLIWKVISKKEHDKYRLAINIPARFAMSVSFDDLRGRGFSFHPFIYGFYKLTQNFSLFHGTSFRWATEDYHKYIYDVDKKYETSTRESYSSSGGYLQTTQALGVIYRKKDYQIFSFLMYADASSNANKKSPLFVKDTNVSGVLGFTWWFWKSS